MYTSVLWRRLLACREIHAHELGVGAPVELFRGSFTSDPFGNANYDISSDGERFLMVQGQTTTDNALMVVLNWTAELKRR